jgi:hypothetical protein
VNAVRYRLRHENDLIGPAAAVRRERWVRLEEASSLSGVPVSSLRRWYRSGWIRSQVGDGNGNQDARLVALDDVVLARASQVVRRARLDAAHARTVEPLLDPWHRAIIGLCDLAQERGKTAALERRRADEAEADVDALRTRTDELESWIEERARYEEVEQLQLGRLLAHASSERESRVHPLIVSPRLVGALVYALAMALLIYLLLTWRI